MQLSPPLTRLWRGMSSPWLIAPLVLGSGLVWFGQFYLPQLPTPLVGNALASAEWLEKTAGKVSGGQIAQVLGLFDLAHQSWVYGLVALFAFVLVLRLVLRGYLAWRIRDLAPPLTWLPFTRIIDKEMAISTPGKNAIHLGEPCHREDIEINEDAQEQTWIGDCHHERVGLQILIELGLLLLLLMLVWQLRTGWQWDELILIPTQTLTFAPYDKQTLQLDAKGETLTFCCNPKQTLSLSAGSLSAGGYRLRVEQKIPSLQIQAFVGDQPLFLQSLSNEGQVEKTLILQFPQARSERALAIPDKNLVLVAVAQEDGRFQVQLRDAQNTPILTTEIAQDEILTWQDLTLNIHLTYASVLSVRRRTGSWLWAPALLFLLLGLYARWRWPYVRVGILANKAGAAIRWQGQCWAHPSLEEISALAFHFKE